MCKLPGKLDKLQEFSNSLLTLGMIQIMIELEGTPQDLTNRLAWVKRHIRHLKHDLNPL